MKANGAKVKPLVEGVGSAYVEDVSPQGHTLIFRRDRGLWEKKIGPGKAKKIAELPDGSQTNSVFSSDGRSVATLIEEQRRPAGDGDQPRQRPPQPSWPTPTAKGAPKRRSARSSTGSRSADRSGRGRRSGMAASPHAPPGGITARWQTSPSVTKSPDTGSTPASPVAGWVSSTVPPTSASTGRWR